MRDAPVIALTIEDLFAGLALAGLLSNAGRTDSPRLLAGEALAAARELCRKIEEANKKETR